MLIVEAEEGHAACANDDGAIVVILRNTHPLTGDICDCLGFCLSPHQALLLSERLRHEAIKMAAPAQVPKSTARVMRWRRASLAPET
ncbi:MAG: hypothetical protein ACK4MQ_11145 [Hyphomonas sp.]